MPAMLNRRHLLMSALPAAALLPLAARAAPQKAYGIDAVQFGVRPNAADDQSGALQRAINRAAQLRVPLILGPGRYRAGGLTLPEGVQIAGVRGATRLVFTRGPSLLAAEGAANLTLTGLTLDGGGARLPENRGLLHLNNARNLRIAQCEIIKAGGNAIALEECDGTVTQNAVSDAADNALFSIDSRGLIVSANAIRDSGNGGIRIWQSEKRRDGSLVADNRIDNTRADAGGSGQNGNAVNVFRAGNVIVRNNIIRSAAFTAVRGAAASDIQILGNNCVNLDEVAIYCEFEFQNAVIADNIVNETASGISVTNFKEGGRLAAVRGNVVRNCRARIAGTKPETQGFGISAEADTAVTGNTVENAETAGISLGWGEYLRDVAATGNVVRNCGIGVMVSVVKGAGSAVIADNMIARAKRAAILGMEWHKPVTGDLALSGAERYPQLRIRGNQIT